MEGERKTVAAAARAIASGRLLRLRERRELRGIFRKVVFASRRSSTSSSAKQKDWINNAEKIYEHNGTGTQITSVADPWHFGEDPDPDPRIHVSD